MVIHYINSWLKKTCLADRSTLESLDCAYTFLFHYLWSLILHCVDHQKTYWRGQMSQLWGTCTTNLSLTSSAANSSHLLQHDGDSCHARHATVFHGHACAPASPVGRWCRGKGCQMSSNDRTAIEHHRQNGKRDLFDESTRLARIIMTYNMIWLLFDIDMHSEFILLLAHWLEVQPHNCKTEHLPKNVLRHSKSTAVLE